MSNEDVNINWYSKKNYLIKFGSLFEMITCANALLSYTWTISMF